MTNLDHCFMNKCGSGAYQIRPPGVSGPVDQYSPLLFRKHLTALLLLIGDVDGGQVTPHR